MTRRIDSAIRSRKLVVSAAAIVGIVGSFTTGLLSPPGTYAQLLHAADAPLPSFEVAAIKPSPPGAYDGHTHFHVDNNRFTASTTAKALIQYAFNAQTAAQLEGGPSWISSRKYEIDAKIEEFTYEQMLQLPRDQQTDQIRRMVQSLLADRFNLKVSIATRQLPIYVLVIAKNGPKLSPPTGPAGSSHGNRAGTSYIATNAPIGALADELSRTSEVGGRRVIDQTGLGGTYDWTLKWTPDSGMSMAKNIAEGGQAVVPTPDSSGPSLFTALQEQLGLKLESQKGPVEVLVIEQIKEPSEN